MSFDLVKLQFYADVAKVSEAQAAKFKQASEESINAGIIERLSEKGVVGAVDRVAYEIAKLSFETAVAFPSLSNTEVAEHEAVKPKVDKMDTIMATIALGSGIHTAIINMMVAERCDHWTKQYCEQLTFLKK